MYYHPDALPPHYEEGGLIYDTMGFGPICKNNDEIVSTLCEYMENGCKMLPEYVKRRTTSSLSTTSTTASASTTPFRKCSRASPRSNLKNTENAPVYSDWGRFLPGWVLTG